VYGIPTSGAVRSLNLASAAAIVLYEALRQVGGLEHARLEGDEGPDFVR
jgi:tRNA(Leu) C34 or U34 (ribose-2'-O)-methylase TrmL